MSGPGLTLLALRCPSCGAGLEAENEDLVFYCAACKNGYQAADSEPVLEPVEVLFLAAPTVAVAEYRPFWRLHATLELLEQQSGGTSEAVLKDRGLGSLLMSFLGRPEAPQAGQGNRSLRFLIPAFRTPLRNAQALGIGLSALEREPEEKLAERLTGASLPVEDARKFAEFLFLLRQEQAPGVLLNLRYRLEFAVTQALVGVPFARRPDGSLAEVRTGLPA